MKFELEYTRGFPNWRLVQITDSGYNKSHGYFFTKYGAMRFAKRLAKNSKSKEVNL